MRLVSTTSGFGRVDGDTYVPMGRDLVDWLGGAPPAGEPPQPLGSVTLLAPVPRPGKILCVGLNYRDHATEAGKDIPREPILFGKFANSVAGPGADVRIPGPVTQVDYEGELAVVIGRRGRDIDAADALDFVAGYTCANDLSARDLQWAQGQWTRGKAIDGFLPLGPWLVTTDEVPDPQALPIRTIVNGEVVQDSSTALMIFSVAEIISFVSRTITLEPGDVIATGTPSGVGFAREPALFLEPGDEVTVEIDPIGSLTTHLV